LTIESHEPRLNANIQRKSARDFALRPLPLGALCADLFLSITLTVKKKQAARSLRGWKAIAEYLSQPTSTAQRWAKDGMPVRREGRNIVADPEELNRWLGHESHVPAAVTIASKSEDLTADLRHGLNALRKKRRAA
jgi:hypothetical protein